jgi:hypothetical protein
LAYSHGHFSSVSKRKRHVLVFWRVYLTICRV